MSSFLLLLSAAEGLTNVHTPTEAVALLSNKSFAGGVVVDTRPRTEYIKSHLVGAVLFSTVDLSECATSDVPVAFYCSAGMASYSAAATFSASGGRLVYAIGTHDDLKAAGAKTESGMPEEMSALCVQPRSFSQEKGADDDHAREVDLVIACSVVSFVVLAVAAICCYCAYATSKRECAAVSDTVATKEAKLAAP